MEQNIVHIAGIDIPKLLYDAANNDNLVIFAGAGISIESNIPNFESLTNEILSGAAKNYDSKLSYPEKLERAEFDGIDIRRETKQIISAKNTGPAFTHDHLIDFFRNKTIRLVTTNFDLNLSDSAKNKKIPCKSHFQPALPIGDKFDGIVYLHGAVSEEDASLIITDRDFARSYLKYGRQTAFIRELFSKYTVLFIGYKYEDKIFQFLTKSDVFHTRYVFVSDEEYQTDPQKWDVLNLTAIPYSRSNNYKQLWEVIQTWGNLINWKPSEHQRELKRIAHKRSPLSQQENDYIKCCLETISLAQYFLAKAKSERWLKWAFDQKLLDVLFRIDYQITELERNLIYWFSENFVTSKYNLSLKIIWLFADSSG